MYSVPHNRSYNLQQIKMLRTAFKNMPFLLVEDALLGSRKACSWTQKSMFLLQVRPVLEKRGELTESWPLPLPLPRREGEWSPRYPYGLDVGCFCLLIGIFIGSNALWTLYAGGVLWARNCAQKCSVNSVRSVRDKTPQRVVCASAHRVGVFFFSQKNTDEQNTQRPTETLSQPISQNLTATFS